MRFDVAQLLKDSIGATRRYDVEEDFPPLEDTGIASAQGWVEFMRTDRGVWARGFLTTTAPFVCSRCLGSFTERLGLPIDEQYYPVVDLNTGKSLAPSTLEEGAFHLSPSHEVNLREAVRQTALTVQPLKPLCRLDCQGLCPQCGANRNEVSCACASEATDPRWGPLLELLASRKAES